MNFRDRFPKYSQISTLMKIRQVGDELLHADRRTDLTNVTDAFGNFANAPKNQSVNGVWVNYGCLLKEGIIIFVSKIWASEE